MGVKNKMNSKQLIVRGQVKTMTFEECYHQFTALRFTFIKKWNGLSIISEEDKHQEISIALYEAYKNYDIDKGIEFMTLAYGTIHQKMMNLYRDTMRSKRKEDYNKVSLDEGINSDDTQKRVYGVEAIKYNEDYGAIDISLMLADKLSDKESKIVKLLFQGYTQQEIADIFGCTQVSVSRYKKKIADKLKAVC